MWMPNIHFVYSQIFRRRYWRLAIGGCDPPKSAGYSPTTSPSPLRLSHQIGLQVCALLLRFIYPSGFIITVAL
jgi:hypothetical protein